MLKSRIESGIYPVGHLLPSENTLIADFNCSRNTIRRAISELVRDGYVQTRQGLGVYNIFQPIEQSSYTVGTIESFQESAHRIHWKSENKVLLFTTCTADAEISARTGFKAGTDLFYLQRLHLLNGTPLILNHSYFRQESMPGLTPEIAGGSIYRYLEQVLNMSIVTSKRTITVEKSTPLDRQYIDLGAYDCLAVVSNQTYNSDGIMFEYTQSRHHPQFFRFQDNAIRRTGNE